jgi:hypothetical protein
MTGAALSTPKSSPAAAVGDPDASSDSDPDAPPEVISSKPPGVVGHGSLPEEIPDSASEIKIPVRNKADELDISVVAPASNDSVKPVNKPRSAQPKKAPYNPFASRPTLLRNVGLLDISLARSLMIIGNQSSFFLKYG